MPEIIKIDHQENEGWSPVEGQETLGLLKQKKFIDRDGARSAAGEQILSETSRILQACGDPAKETNAETGIIIGYVQSGKTLSFTTLTAMASDNDYRIIIVLGGTSLPLLSQSTNRLMEDLRIDERYSFEQKWTLLTNPGLAEQNKISSLLDQWRDSTYKNERCKTILITVMKHGSHLRNLTEVLKRVNLSHSPTLIVDDESDQASLDTKARSSRRKGVAMEDIHETDTSTIYRRINALRDALPHFTYLQYTATPQANLFINLMDRLSPNFIRLLTPGGDYTGGMDFFRGPLSLVKEIPLSEIATNSEPLDGPPESLLEALRFYYLGVVAGNITESFREAGQKNRSMLVHPSRLQGDHAEYVGWLTSIKNSWKRLLQGEDNEERAELLATFEKTYTDLATTVTDLPTFEELSGDELIHAISYTPIKEVNSRNGSTPQIRWQDDYSIILVGGQSMDRGFTVEGLTVTYMPRNIGMGTVDTILQRARFYGYKRQYLGYCRVFLDQETIDAYGHIVDHEADIRNRLREFDQTGTHLDSWKRETVLDSMLKLTRANILYDDLERHNLQNKWLRISAPHDTEELIDQNRQAVMDFVRPLESAFSIMPGHPGRTKEQIHLMAQLPIAQCMSLLNKLKYTYLKDSNGYSSLRGLIAAHLQEHPEDTCVVYLMKARSIDEMGSRERSLDEKGEVLKLHQGKNASGGEITYPGDDRIKDPGQLSIQIHLLDLKETAYTRVPTLAIWVPERLGKPLIRKI